MLHMRCVCMVSSFYYTTLFTGFRLGNLKNVYLRNFVLLFAQRTIIHQHFSVVTISDMDSTGSLDSTIPAIGEEKKEEIVEGKARLSLNSKFGVFYNPVQEFNRDLSIAALCVYSDEHRKNVLTLKEKEKRKQSQNITNSADSCVETREVHLDNTLDELDNDGMTILEALSATGLRSIRYAKEIPNVKHIVANDWSKKAVLAIEENVKQNGVENIVSISNSDASLLMYNRRGLSDKFNVIDLDPYGCPSMFLDAAVQCCAEGGLLLVTCTDMAVLAGNAPETCYSKYGALSLRSEACHEMALRIVLQCIESHANRYSRYIEPVLSVSADFYVRVLVRIKTSAAMCKRSIGKLSMVYQCVGCDSHTLQPLGVVNTKSPNDATYVKMSLPHVPAVAEHCIHCRHRHTVGGPIWNAPIHDLDFVAKMLELVSTEEGKSRFGTARRMEGMLSLILEELPDVPLYLGIDKLCSKVHTQMIPHLDFVSALLNAGYRVSETHARKNSVKTNAPQSVVWDIMRAWEKDHPSGKHRKVEGSVTSNILSLPCETQVNFTRHPECETNSRRSGLCRYHVNPPNWGPGCRSIVNNSSDRKLDKQKRNQNKNAKKRKLQQLDSEKEQQCGIAEGEDRIVKPKFAD